MLHIFFSQESFSFENLFPHCVWCCKLLSCHWWARGGQTFWATVGSKIWPRRMEQEQMGGDLIGGKIYHGLYCKKNMCFNVSCWAVWVNNPSSKNPRIASTLPPSGRILPPKIWDGLYFFHRQVWTANLIWLNVFCCWSEICPFKMLHFLHL